MEIEDLFRYIAMQQRTLTDRQGIHRVLHLVNYVSVR